MFEYMGKKCNCETCCWCMEADPWGFCQLGHTLSEKEIRKLMVLHGSRNLHSPL